MSVLTVGGGGGSQVGGAGIRLSLLRLPWAAGQSTTGGQEGQAGLLRAAASGPAGEGRAGAHTTGHSDSGMVPGPWDNPFQPSFCLELSLRHPAVLLLSHFPPPSCSLHPAPTPGTLPRRAQHSGTKRQGRGPGQDHQGQSQLMLTWQAGRVRGQHPAARQAGEAGSRPRGHPVRPDPSPMGL